MITPIPISATAPTPPAMPPIRAPLLDFLELDIVLFPPLDPPTAVADAPGKFAVAMGLAPLLVAAEPPVAAATAYMLVEGTNLAIDNKNTKGAGKRR
jgi:hypothetical protein